ncbi:hypothetical protein ALC56_11256 [Trachymyrmex septentrionalis]|uniref:Uncharacterized protein n=1 Tax=Trachymyrmex septentrionalis TaxID=34720 RepID=A0A195F0P1_9HYME|nr:hypothetical protein ALC56_11256 [Trachymyrmex septentrionalis]
MYPTAAAAAAAGLTTTTMGQSSSNTGHSGDRCCDVSMTMGNIRDVGLENSVLLAFSFHPPAPGFEGLQDAPAPPSCSHLSRRIIGVPWSPGMGRRWYCHMADTGAGLRRPASKTAIAHPHKSTTDPARVSLPSNYLIDVTRAVRRAMSFFYATSISTEVLYISEAHYVKHLKGVKHACTHVAQANVAESGLTDVLESPPDHGETPTWPRNKLARHNKLKPGVYPRRRGRIVVGFLFTGRAQLVLGSNDANGGNFPDGFEVNQWQDFKEAGQEGSLGCCCCYQVNVLTATVVGGTTDVENFDLENWGLRPNEGEGRGRDESGGC